MINSYLSYDDYVNMGGRLSPSTYHGYEYQAEAVINYRTFDRLVGLTISEQPERTQHALRHCVFELVRQMQIADAQTGVANADTTDGDVVVSNIASQSNDGVSVSYSIISASEAAANSKSQIATIIERSLSGCVDSLGRKLLYRGLYKNE